MRALVVVVVIVAAAAIAAADEPPAWSRDDVLAVLGAVCDDGGADCSLAGLYSRDAKAAASARALFDADASLAGVGSDETMDGGYRGKIHLVPQLPVGGYRVHLARVAWAMTSIDAFFRAQLANAASPRYRWRALAFRFVRSVGKHTPSAYASIVDRHLWTIVYNVEGSLLGGNESVRETLFHELFHLNDEAHDGWSERALSTDYDAIVKKCGTKVRCLAPYAPNDTMVRGGTYYAFQQHNGVPVREYAAELAVRYFKEQSEMRARGKLSRAAFKCGPPENARSWRSLVDEFFAGRDLVPACRP
jgi:hypothetical protein